MQKVWLAMCGQLMIRNLANSWHGTEGFPGWRSLIHEIEYSIVATINFIRILCLLSPFQYHLMLLPSVYSSCLVIGFVLTFETTQFSSFNFFSNLVIMLNDTSVWKYWQNKRYLKRGWPTSIGAKNEGKSARKIIDFWARVLTLEFWLLTLDGRQSLRWEN